jgi:hypothetical protein
VRRERDGDVKQERIVEEVVDLERNAVAPIALPAGAGERLPTRQCRSTCLKARQGARRPRTSRLRTPGGGLQVHAAAGLERTVGEGDPLGHCPRATETASKSFTLESGWGARAAQRRGGEQGRAPVLMVLAKCVTCAQYHGARQSRASVSSAHGQRAFGSVCGNQRRQQRSRRAVPTCEEWILEIPTRRRAVRRRACVCGGCSIACTPSARAQARRYGLPPQTGANEPLRRGRRVPTRAESAADRGHRASPSSERANRARSATSAPLSRCCAPRLSCSLLLSLFPRSFPPSFPSSLTSFTPCFMGPFGSWILVSIRLKGPTSALFGPNSLLFNSPLSKPSPFATWI